MNFHEQPYPTVLSIATEQAEYETRLRQDSSCAMAKALEKSPIPLTLIKRLGASAAAAHHRAGLAFNVQLSWFGTIPVNVDLHNGVSLRRFYDFTPVVARTVRFPRTALQANQIVVTPLNARFDEDGALHEMAISRPNHLLALLTEPEVSQLSDKMLYGVRVQNTGFELL
jgi:hypothetical protein